MLNMGLNTLTGLKVIGLIGSAASVAAAAISMFVDPKIQTLEIQKAVAEAIAKQKV